MKISRITSKFHSINLIVYDVETFDDLRFRFAIVRHDMDYLICESQEELTSGILSFVVNGTNAIVAHSAQFDYAFIKHSMFNRQYRLSKMSMQPFFINFKSRDKHRRKSLLFLDSMNYMRVSLKEIGVMIGLPKLHSDSKEELTDFYKDATKDEWIEYCTRDVDICYYFMQFVSEFHQEYDVPFSITFPQFSYRVFRKHFMPCDVFATEEPRVMRLERESYHGGRVEAFDMRVYASLNCYDVNSLYPFVMKENLYPVRLRKYYTTASCADFSLQELRDIIINESCVIARVRVNIPKCHIGPIPKVHKTKLMFPVGEYEAVLCSPELRIIEPFITSITELAVYHAVDIFSDYVDTMYNLRMTAKNEKRESEQQMYKLFLNSLYGKFAQRKFIFERTPQYDNHFQYATADVDGKLIRWFGGVAYSRTIEIMNKFAAVSISSFVTSYARTYLYNRAIMLNNLVYCDTDSLFTTDELQLSTQLGGLKLEKVYHNFQALGNKMYRADEVFKVKGVTSPIEALIDEDNKELHFEFERFTKLTETVKRDNSPLPRIIEQKKTYRLSYDKRKVNKNKTTKCLVLRE